VLLRSGHTEAAVDLCKLAGLPPVGVISELMNDDGTVMKGEQVARFAATHKLKHVTIADMIAYRQAREKLIERISTFVTESPIGPLQGYAYRSPFDEIAHAAFVYNGIGDGKNVLTRLHKPNSSRTCSPARRACRRCCSTSRRPAAASWFTCATVRPEFPSSRWASRRRPRPTANRQWREVGVGAQILRDIGVTSIVNLTSSVHDYKGLSRFRYRDRCQRAVGHLRVVVPGRIEGCEPGIREIPGSRVGAPRIGRMIQRNCALLRCALI